MRRPLIFHPLLIGLFPLFFLFTHNLGRMHFQKLYLPLAATVFFIGIVWFLCFLFTRDRAKASCIASLFLVLFFSFGHLYGLIRNLNVAGVNIGRARFLIPFEVIFFTVTAIGIAKTKSGLVPVTRFLNKSGMFLILVPFLLMGRNLFVKGDWMKQSGLTVPLAGQRPNPLPDIYYIIPDGYGRQDILKKFYGHDNSAFGEGLRKRGFYIADGSRANYPITRYSLASSMNFTHLGLFQGGKLNKIMTFGMVEKSRVVRFLKQEGYVFVAFGTGSGLTDIPSADVYLFSRQTLDEFETTYLGSTPLPLIIFKIYPNFFKGLRQKRFIFTLDHLPEVAKSDRPVFVFVHLMVTHHPYPFQENGTIIGDREQDTAEYIRHVQILNQEILKSIDRILAESSQPPVIILQSDHGPTFWELYRPGANFHQVLRASADKQDHLLTERMSILNAYYLPGFPEGVLYQGITPVNTFRVILDQYFHTGLGLLEDRSFIFNDSTANPFLDVTKILNDLEAKEG